MTYNVRPARIQPSDYFVAALFVLVIGKNIGDGDWGDVLDGAAVLTFFAAWVNARRWADAYEHAFDVVTGRKP